MKNLKSDELTRASTKARAEELTEQLVKVEGADNDFNWGVNEAEQVPTKIRNTVDLFKLVDGKFDWS